MIFGLLVEKISLPVAPRHRWLNRITLIGSPPVASRLQKGTSHLVEVLLALLSLRFFIKELVNALDDNEFLKRSKNRTR